MGTSPSEIGGRGQVCSALPCVGIVRVSDNSVFENCGMPGPVCLERIEIDASMDVRHSMLSFVDLGAGRMRVDHGVGIRGEEVTPWNGNEVPHMVS